MGREHIQYKIQNEIIGVRRKKTKTFMSCSYQ